MDKKFEVLVVGELNVDLILNKIDSFPEMGKEKLADEMTLTLGSSSAIFASNLSSLGVKVGFIGKIGKDSFGDLVLKSLKEKDVNTDFIISDNNLKTGATIVLNYDEDRAMVTHPGAMEELTIDDISSEQIKSAKHLHISSIFLQPKIKDSIIDLLVKAKKAGLTTSLDPQWDPNEKWDIDLRKLLPFIDVFLPNETEIAHLTNEPDTEKSLKMLAPFANLIVVKMGSKGSALLRNGNISIQPAYLNENVVDAIGAGDSFDAGFISKFVHGESPIECQRFGNLCGAINTTAAGGTGAFSDYGKMKESSLKNFGVVL